MRLIWPALSSLPWVLDCLKCCFQLGVCWRTAWAPVACQRAWNLVAGSFYSYIDDFKKQKIKAFHIPAHSRKAIQRQLAWKKMTNRRIKNQEKKREDSKILLALFTKTPQEDALGIKPPKTTEIRTRLLTMSQRSGEHRRWLTRTTAKNRTLMISKRDRKKKIIPRVSETPHFLHRAEKDWMQEIWKVECMFCSFGSSSADQ